MSSSADDTPDPIPPETPQGNAPRDEPQKDEPLQRGSGGEYIAADAPHWRREAFIPVATEDLGLELSQLPGVSGPAFRRAVARIVRYLARGDQIRRRRLTRLYAPLDPDREVVRIDAAEPTDHQIARTTQAIRDILERAAYTRLSDQEVRDSVRVASAWGVRVLVDFDQLGEWAVYARGDVCGVRPRRHWKKLWRREPTEVPLYQRLVVIFRLAPEAMVLGESLTTGRLHLRLFKNIPKLDVDMLLPATKPKLGWIDRTRILLPTIGNVGMTVFKIARGLLVLAFVGLYGTLALLALVVAGCMYAVRSVFVYLQTRDRLLLSMTRSLYFQKLDSGAGVLWNLCQSAVEQEIEEAMVAAAVLIQAGEPLSEEEIRQRGTRFIAMIAQVDVLYRASVGIDILIRSGIARRVEDQKIAWTQPCSKHTS